MRHSSAHVMAAAVCRLFNDVKLDIGPATDDGFYYDFDLPKRLAPEDFPAIEQEINRIISENLPFERFIVSREEAVKMLEEKNQTYKLERLKDIPEGEEISFYRCGDFLDLCRGPHVDKTGDIKAVKLVSVAGSYFRGIETNPMLQRLYGIAAQSKQEMDEILKRIEEAAKRDHRKLGKELDLFSIEEDVGPGLVHWHPKGARIRSLIEDFWRREHFRAGYEIMYTPHIGRAHLWETSGHLEFYKENMYSPMDIDGNDYYVKPMNCPFHIQIYKSHLRSYRDLPLRWAELGTVYRYEKSGVLHGLLRVRGFTQDDAHIFCTPEKIQDEVKETVRFGLKILRAFGFTDVNAYLATKPAKAVGEDSRWEQATLSLEEALKAENISYTIDKGGGAFYGPKIDLKIKDAIGREWQLGTIQFDFNLPEGFNLTYIGEDGKEHRPYMVHRALLGSLERFFGILIEHYGGAFPLWLAPEQVRILPITEHQMSYGESVMKTLAERDFRVTLDRKSEKVGAKIRRTRAEKVPYMLIVGGKEAEAGTVSVRTRTDTDMGVMTVDAFVGMLEKENMSRG
ncbi:MAG: threonine--tRNA ligase [Kiritimatiellae bacterium]|nr:threonine--tRNA ligase [Kiritimatiellia bacterium]MDD5522103.1 threonine--tRNA ligase [Kiritimatiellia bacterium]